MVYVAINGSVFSEYPPPFGINTYLFFIMRDKSFI